MVDQPKRVVAAIQARMGSCRLPGKALLPIHGRPVIVRIWERLSLCQRLDTIVVACPDTPENDIIAAVCTREGIGCVRGSETQVGHRLLGAATSTSADAIVRITGDCPLVSPALVDQVVAIWLGQNPGGWRTALPCDYISNVFPRRTFPDGLDVELFTVECLRAVADLPHTEEISRNVWERPGAFRVASLEEENDLSRLRWTLDTPEDLAFVRAVWGELPEGFEPKDVLALGRGEASWWGFGVSWGPRASRWPD